MKRIIHVIDHWGLGGAQRFLANLVGMDPVNRHQVLVLYRHGNRDWGVQPRFLGSSYHASGLVMRRLRHCVRREQPDLVQIHLHGSKLFAYMTGIAHGQPLIWHEHSAQEHHHVHGSLVAGLLDRALRRAASQVDYVIANSRSTADFSANYWRIPSDRIQLVPIPIWPSEVRRLASISIHEKPSRPVIGFVGRLAAQKNPGDFVRAVGEVVGKGRDVAVWIVGDGPLRPRLEEQVQEAGLADRVTFWGDREDVYALMRHMHVLVMPSLFEPFGLVAREALALGVTVVGYAVDGLGEQLRAHDHAIAAQPGDLEQLNGAILQALDRSPQASIELSDEEDIQPWLDFYRSIESIPRRNT